MSYRVLQAMALLVSFRIITLEYGPDVYGFVSLFMTFAAYLIFFDFGVVSFMRTEIPHAYTLHGERNANAVAREGLKGLLIYAGSSYSIILAILLLSDHVVNWLHVLIKLPDLIEPKIIRDAILALLIYAALMVTGNLILAILSAKGKQYRYFLAMIFGSLLQVVCIAVTAKLGIPINWLFVILLLSGTVPLLWLIVPELVRVLRTYDPAIKVRTFNGTSSAFFVVQVGGLIVNNMDVLIVAHLYSMQEVAVYSTMKLIIQLPISLHGSYIMQAWPIFSAMRAENRIDDIRSLLQDRLLKTFAFSVTSAIFLTALAPFAMHLWSNGRLEVSHTVAFMFSALLVLYTYSACYSILIFSFNYIHPLALTVPAIIPVLYGISIYGRSAGFGIGSIVLANIFVQTFGLVVGVYFFHFKLSRQRKTV